MSHRMKPWQFGDAFTLIYCYQQGSITRYALLPSCLMLGTLTTKPADMNLPIWRQSRKYLVYAVITFPCNN